MLCIFRHIIFYEPNERRKTRARLTVIIFFFPFYVENWYTFWGADRKAKLYLLQVETLTILFFSLFETYIFAKNNFFLYRVNHWVFKDDEIRYIDQKIFKISFNNFNPYKLNFFFFYCVWIVEYSNLNIRILLYILFKIINI